MFHPQRQHSMVISPCWPQGAHGETYACARSPTFTGAHTHTLWLITEQTLHALRWINVKWAALRPLSKTGKNIPSHPQTVSPSAPSCVFLRKHHAAVSSELAGILPGTLMLPMHETARPPLLPITDPRYSAHSHGELGRGPPLSEQGKHVPTPSLTAGPAPLSLSSFRFFLSSRNSDVNMHWFWRSRPLHQSHLIRTSIKVCPRVLSVSLTRITVER